MSVGSMQSKTTEINNEDLLGVVKSITMYLIMTNVPLKAQAEH